ncbi:MAG: DNA polymerase I, thermostable [Dehalococcoidia bacterium]|nr:DNA polymerase I, thermostable [Chloroflexota bacterium]
MKFPDLSAYPLVSLDFETTGLIWWRDKIFGVAVSVDDRDFYFDTRREPGALDWLRREIPRVRHLTNHNMKFDWHFARNAGIVFPEARTTCTMIRAALIDEHRMAYDLDSLARDCLGERKGAEIYGKLAELFGGRATRQAQMPNLSRAPVELVGNYAKQDTRLALKLWRWQEEKINAQGLASVHRLEQELLPVIVRMEEGGVRVDVEKAEKAVRSLDVKAATMQRDLNSLAGFAVNPNPSNSIKELFKPKRVANSGGTEFWQAIDGTALDSTEAGAACINADALRRMKHPAASMILSLRKILKARDTFLKGHVLGNHHVGFIHANINQTKSEGDVGTGTGRLSINGPALQQIPKRDKEMAAIVRAVFVPDVGAEWVCNDWAQMDFRVFAHYVNDPAILEIYAKDPDTDFHSLTASMTGLPRSPRFAGDPNAKQINLGLVFGMGQGGLAEEMGLPYTVEPNGRGGTYLKPGPEAEAVFHKYHSSIPGVKELLRDASTVARSRGYVKTIMGRHIRFPRGMLVHKAGGLVFQGTAADCLKVKLVELDHMLRNEFADSGARLLLNVHDEFDCSVPPDRADIREAINRCVTSFGQGDRINLRVPVRTDQGRGPDWWEASK